LQANLSLYLDELSRVFFQKSNIRDRAPSWLSIFYSFCIQSLVRHALVRIVAIPEAERPTNEKLAASQYLYLPLRLFTATSSGSKDAFFPAEGRGTELASNEHYHQARRAVDYDYWPANGIQTPAEYLKVLFQDQGQGLEINPDRPQDNQSLDDDKLKNPRDANRQKRHIFRSSSCQQCRISKTRVSGSSA